MSDDDTLSKRAAEHRLNVCRALMKARAEKPMALAVEDAKAYLSGYRELAEKQLGDSEAEFVDDGLSAYEESFEQNDPDILLDWIAEQNLGENEIDTSDLLIEEHPYMDPDDLHDGMGDRYLTDSDS